MGVGVGKNIIMPTSIYQQSQKAYDNMFPLSVPLESHTWLFDRNCVFPKRLLIKLCFSSYYNVVIFLLQNDENTYCFVTATAIDSRLEFKKQEPVRYTLLLEKAFPGLDAFTIVFWVNTSNTQEQGTILSYKEGTQENLLRMVIGRTLSLEIWGRHISTDVTLYETRWYHIAWTWTAAGKFKTLNPNIIVNGNSSKPEWLSLLSILVTNALQCTRME